MHNVSSLGSRAAAVLAAFSLSFFLVAASFAPQGAFAAEYLA
jgi:hypothetical protein